MTSVDAIGEYAESLRQCWNAVANAVDIPDDAPVTVLPAYSGAREMAQVLDCRVDLLWHPDELCAPHRLWIADWLASFWEIVRVCVLQSQRRSAQLCAETLLSAAPVVLPATGLPTPTVVAGQRSGVTAGPCGSPCLQGPAPSFPEMQHDN